jgi:hypothetical protein
MGHSKIFTDISAFLCMGYLLENRILDVQSCTKAKAEQFQLGKI